jgi:hypothetical protein
MPPTERGQDLEGLLATLRDLSRTSTPPTGLEIRAAGEALLNRRRFADFASLRTLVARTGPGSALLDDGGFERTDRFYRQEVSQFDWNIISTENAAGNLDESEGGHVAVSTRGRAVQTAVYRYLPLKAGAYRLSYSVRGESNSPESIGVSVSCAAGAQVARSTRDPLSGNGWQTRQLTFRTDENCPIIMIDIRGLGTEAAEAQFDNFILQRMD